MHGAASLLASLYDTHVGLANRVFNMLTFIVVKASTTLKQRWQRDADTDFLKKNPFATSLVSLAGACAGGGGGERAISRLPPGF